MKTKAHKGWRKENSTISLEEVNSSIKVITKGSFWKKLFSFLGPGSMVAVGYMDPGNWATDIAGGSQFGYTLISVILISNLFAILLQHLSLKLGIVTGRDLAQACRDHYSKPVAIVLWILCELAIIACDLAEVLGAAIALNLLFGLPLYLGVIITVLDVFIILYLQNKGFRWVEALVISLLTIIAICFAYEIIVSKPDWYSIVSSLVPRKEIITNPGMLYVAIGILGATVMPHNLYLHSSIVQTRDYDRDDVGKKHAIKFATIDSTVSLLLAFFVNASILVLAAATFHKTGNKNIVDISDAYKMLDPLLGVKYAAMFFGIALLLSGLNSTLTGTIAGQIVMEGFINLKLKPWLRRLITRLLAVVPGLIAVIYFGDRAAGNLLVLSQVVLSLQLPFAVIPLVLFTSQKDKMGQFTNKNYVKVVAWGVTFIIVGLNLYLLYTTFIA